MVAPAMWVSKPQGMLRLTKCEDCTLCDGNRPLQPVGGAGPLNAKIVVVGEAPGFHEVQGGLPFVGQSGKLLWHELERHHVARRSVYATNVLACPSIQGKPVRAKDVDACSGRFWDELSRLHPSVILCLGSPAATALRGTDSKITELSGHYEWSEKFHCFLVFSVHPAAVLRTPDLYQDFAWAVQVAVDMLDETPGPIQQDPIDYKVASGDDIDEVLGWLDEASRQSDIVVDLETTGLYPHNDRILSLGLCWNDDLAYIIPGSVIEGHDAVSESVKHLLEESHLTGHNFKFDAHFLRAQWGVRARVGDDTMLMHYAMDERSGGGAFHDLKRCARKYCDAPLYAENIDTKDTLKIAPTDLYRYQAFDCVYTRRLKKRLLFLLEREPKSPKGYPEPIQLYRRLLIPAANTLLNLEERGVRIDVKKLLETKAQYLVMMEETRQRAVQALEASGVMVPPTLNLGSVKQVQRVLYEPRPHGLDYGDVGSTAEEAIHELQRRDKRNGRESNAFLELLLTYRSQKHTVSTYLDGILGQLVRGNKPGQPDGRIRTNFLLHGAKTGRLASRGPNLQNIPADSVIKELFVAPPGYVLLNADYRRLEVGVLAYYSKDKALTQDFNAEDFHWNVAQKVFGTIVRAMEAARYHQSVPELQQICTMVTSLADFARRQERPAERTDDPEVLYGWMKTRLRRQAKYVSFGIMYGEGAYALAQEEKGLGVPVRDAARYISAWKQSYPDAVRFLEASAATARRQQWVESQSGRRRRFAYPLDIIDEQRNEAMNMPIQAFASDINLASLIALDRMLPEAGLGFPLIPVHDSILFQLVEPKLDEAKEMIHRVMTTRVVDNPDIVFEIDMATGHSWGECH